MKQNKILLASLMLIMSMSAYAKVADLQQEVKIKAVSQTADIKNNQIIFFGPVEVTQVQSKSKLPSFAPFLPMVKPAKS